LSTLSEISRLTAKLEWPLRDLFGEIERSKAKNVFLEAGMKSGEEGSAPADGAPEASLRATANEPTPLKPTGDTNPIDLGAVRRFFAPDGALGSTFDGYEQREQQVEMSEQVAAAFNNSDAVMVEAGTGTGKGMA
ncbi:hypothetical protein SE17_41980, partial [Kouleothrix aurantiaca]